MRQAIKHLYDFGPFRLDANERILLLAHKHVPLQPKVFETLLVLVERHGHIVEKDELMRLIWPDSFVEEINLAKNISILRKVLANADAEHEYIETIPKRGYRFAAEVRKSPSDAVDSVPPLRVSPPETAATADLAKTLSAYSSPDPLMANQTAAATNLSETSVVTRNLATPKQTLFRWLPLASFVFIPGLLVAGYWLFQGGWKNAISTFQSMQIKLLPTIGQTRAVAISPDGQFIAYTKLEPSYQNSVWIRPIETTAEGLQLVPPVRDTLRGLSFTPDGTSLYYSLLESRFNRSLWRVPAVGGPPQKLASLGHSSPVGLSPNGEQLAFVRENSIEGLWSLIVAKADGSAERVIATRHAPEYFSIDEAPSWSPDGKSIACVLGNLRNGVCFSALSVAVSDGAEQTLTGEDWSWLRQVAWLTNGQGWVLAGRLTAEPTNNQLWLLTAKGGTPRRITNDLSNYGGNFSLTADNNSLIAVREEYEASLWVIPNNDAARAHQLTFGNQRTDGMGGLSWSPDGRIVFSSQTGGQKNLWIVNADGTQLRQLTANLGENYCPSVSPDGRYIVFVSTRYGNQRLWRIELEGNNPTQLTNGLLDHDPQCTPDGKSVIFTAEQRGKRTLWQIPLEGGDARPLADRYFENPVLSPDGQWLACTTRDETDPRQRLVAIVHAQTGQVQRLLDTNFPFLLSAGLGDWPSWQFTPDSKALAGIYFKKDRSNVWSLPLNGNSPAQLTNFKEGFLGAFAWSRDGQQLACARGTAMLSSTIIRGFLNSPSPK